MKQPSGAKLDRYCLRSMHWIAVSHRRGGGEPASLAGDSYRTTKEIGDRAGLRILGILPPVYGRGNAGRDCSRRKTVAGASLKSPATWFPRPTTFPRATSPRWRPLAIQLTFSHTGRVASGEAAPPVVVKDHSGQIHLDQRLLDRALTGVKKLVHLPDAGSNAQGREPAFDIRAEIRHTSRLKDVGRRRCGQRAYIPVWRRRP